MIRKLSIRMIQTVAMNAKHIKKELADPLKQPSEFGQRPRHPVATPAEARAIWGIRRV